MRDALKSDGEFAVGHRHVSPTSRGSTRLLRERPGDYGRLLAEHQRILRGAFEHHGGVQASVDGDALFFVFASAREAAVAAQEAVEQLSGGPVRVRIGDPPTQCGDGVDNDLDGKADYPADLGCASLFDPSESPDPPPPPPVSFVARVVRVIDGDTIKVRTRLGRQLTVRLVGIDVPASGSPIECGARRATAYMKQQVKLAAVGAWSAWDGNFHRPL